MNEPTEALAIASESGLVQQAETISSVLAAQAKAEVQARYIVAMQRPRNFEKVRQVLNTECERTGFAEVAYYRISNRGEGLSVRFAEAAARAMGNLDTKAIVTYEDDDMRIVKATVTDIESNFSISSDIVVSKTVERKFLKKGEVAISQRINSDGKVVYLRKANDDEVMPKQNAAISKAFRNGILRLLPGDIQDECRRRILQIWKGDPRTDPKEQIRKIIDTFGAIGVYADDLVEYLGHSIETCSPAELENLRNLVRSIRSGETTWHAEMTHGEPDDAGDDKAGKTGAESLKDQLRKEQKK